ncbi:MAG: MFS transporter, partial [Planctomycetota bacterium]|nr:MFS transporter [Planctomycetota bacterium]
MPDQTRTSMPGGVPYIVGNEAAERFSFYGMKTILVVFMTQYLVSSAGEPAFLSDSEAREAMGWFVASAYFFPVIGALIADALLGKYLTIMILSWVYVLGHACLAMMDLPSAALEATFEPKQWLLIGLFLIAVGSGGIKPCVSAHVGDQFGRGNKHLLSRVFGWFYFSINFGSFFSTLLTPYLLKNAGAGWAFGIPGVLMFLATIVFWMGRHKFVHIQPRGWEFVRQAFTGDGLGVILKLVPVYIFIAVFWSLYDQTGSAWVLQAGKMDRNFLGIDWLESQVQAINPLLILAYIPLFTYLVYPAIS